MTPTATRDAVEFPDDVIRAVCEVETRYIQGYTYSETHVIRDIMRPATDDTLWRGPACTPANDAAFYARCEIEKMRRRLSALTPHITALIDAARKEGAGAERDACANLAQHRHHIWRFPHPDDAEPGEVCDDVSACADIAAAIRARTGDAREGETG